MLLEQSYGKLLLTNASQIKLNRRLRLNWMNCTGSLVSVMLSWSGLKKRSMGWPAESVRPRELAHLIDSTCPKLTIARQAELLGLDRQTYYYQPVINESAQALLKRQMDAIDAIYTD